jgi:short-subunit dehydrogenase
VRLHGRRVVVTGASSGIGREIARELARRGVCVLAVGRDERELEEVRAFGGGVSILEADISTPEGQALVVERAGSIHALVNDAGVGWVGLFADMPIEEIERIVSVNLLALLALTRRLLPALSRGGHIVNIGSVLGLASSPPLTVYSATKFAVHGFSEGLREELRGKAWITEIQPGPVNTRFFFRATHRPHAAEVPGFPMMEPSRVAAAVARALERPGWPGYRRIAVPRGIGILTRLGTMPGPRLLRSGISLVAESKLVLRPPSERGR